MPNTRTHHSMGGLPIGTVLDYAGTTAPDGALLCFGQAVSRTTYAALFAVISTTYGTGDGTTTFNLPDARGRVCAGKDDMGGSAASRLTSGGSGVNGASLGAVGGAQTHTLTTTEMPAHTHSEGIAIAGGNTGTGGSGYGFPNAGTTGSAGGGGAHNNTQPTIVLNKIIIFQ
jgi:microcystin-dependent protein